MGNRVFFLVRKRGRAGRARKRGRAGGRETRKSRERAGSRETRGHIVRNLLLLVAKIHYYAIAQIKSVIRGEILIKFTYDKIPIKRLIRINSKQPESR